MKSCWSVRKLGDVANLYQPKTITSADLLSEGPFKVFGANGVIGFYDKFNHRESEVAVTCRGATCGTVNFTEPRSWITGNAMVVTPRDASLNKRYLFYALRGSSLNSVISGTAQPQITRKSFSPLEIPVPPLAEQERIVKLLDEADELRKLRTQADQRTATLIPALFHEMFGDPATNRKKLPIRQLGDICEVVGGGTPSKKRPEYWTGTIPWVSPKDMACDVVADSEDHISGQALEASATNLIPAGSILVVTRSGILKHTLPVATNSVPVTINQDIKAFIPSDGCESSFLATQLRVLAPRILNSVRVGATVQNIETESLKRLSMVCPSRQSQKDFAARVAEIRELESRQAASRQRLDVLFQSMLHRAFNGEL